MAKVLLLEPDSLLAGSVSEYLKSAGHTVIWRREPQSAVTSADRRPPDIVVLEIQLAGRSGTEFLYEFRSYPDWQDTPVIIFTNLSEDEVRAYTEVMDQLKISACLAKSRAGLDELADRIDRVLRPAAV